MLVHTQNFSVSLFVAVIIGFGKGLIIIYLALLIPNHVSLKKLPAALGIYLAFFGIFLIVMAPVAGNIKTVNEYFPKFGFLGWIRDLTQSYVTTVHILHILIYIAVLSWIYEYLSKKRKLQSKLTKF